ncbi:MAG: ATP-binding protein [Candidatus Aminicenantes bacterium]|nr:ATP-binding protein [Candidatus Aminicenantes bacterium]
MLIQRLLTIPWNKNIFLFGPRQTGKSTLIKSQCLDEQTLYFDLLQQDVYRRFLSRPETFRAEVQAAVKDKKFTRVIVDEVQKVPMLLDEIHALIESGSGCSFILSGSSSRKLKRQHANMLAGRAWTFFLYPLSSLELKYRFDLRSALQFGTLPSVFLENIEESKQEMLRSYVGTYLHEEIEMEANIRNLGGFLRFLPIAAAQNGELLNYANLARETGVTAHTAREYFKILEDTLLGFFLFPFARSIRKRLVSHPKFYFFDTGVVTALTNRLRVDLADPGYEFGRAFEHWVILELIRLNHYLRLDLRFSFYRTERGAEVDCIIESPNQKVFAVEIKATDNPSSSMLRGLHSFAEKMPQARLILACRVPRPQRLGKVDILPWEDMLALIRSEA